MGDVRFFKKQVEGYTGRHGLLTALDTLRGDSKIWAALRECNPVRSVDLERATALGNESVLYYMNALERAGYVWREPAPKRRYHLLKDTGELAPIRQRGGRALYDPNLDQEVALKQHLKTWPGQPAPVGSFDSDLFQLMVMMRAFTASDLAPLMKRKASAVERKLRILHRFSYIRCNGRSGGERWYQLPEHRVNGQRLAPSISLKLGKLYDHNTREIIDIKQGA
ncbi:hypothetical protein ACH42_08475 [Endozoicomonas sp. (ex Bugula neritina AB1)]|nr:hypothetical protein ACH42_08475 [Endozoicomonas sp. (ex Bugula neritina AB1)]